MRRAIRIPLEVGISAVNHLTLGALCISLGVAVIVGSLVVVIATHFQGLAILQFAFYGGLVFAFGARQWSFGWDARPADIVLEGSGFRVDGGPHHGLAFEWHEIKTCTLRKQSTEDNAPSGLWLDDDLCIAEADDYDEVRSLEETAEAISSCLTSTYGRAPPARRATTGEIACPNCGAPASPSMEDVVACLRCGAAVSMPPDVRDRVRAALDLPAAERRVDRLVTKLLDQPGAQSTMLVLLVSLGLLASAWPLTVWAYVRSYQMHRLSVELGFVLAALPVLLVLDGYFLSRLRMVDRRALASLVTGFGARPPAQAGDPPRCRSCWAPLRNVDQTVVRCVFCNASNITGVDLRALAGRTADAQDSLEWAMSVRNMSRRVWVFGAAFGAVAAFATVLLLHHVYAQTDALPVDENLHVRASWPQPSPDGSVVVLQQDKAWKVFDAHTTTVSGVMPSLARATALAPLGSGRFVAALPKGKGTEIDVVDASGGTVLIALSRYEVRRIVVSPDASRIAVVIGWNTKVASISVRSPVALDDLPEASFDARSGGFMDGLPDTSIPDAQAVSPSPDGQHVVFVSGSDAHTELYEARVGSRRTQPLTDDCGDCRDPAWSADGYIYFTSHGTLHRVRAGYAH